MQLGAQFKSMAYTRRNFVKLAGAACAGVAVARMAASVPSAFASEFAGGTGTADDPYKVATAEQLAAVADDLAACYALEADIDLAGVAWTPLGCCTYSSDMDMTTGEVNVAKIFSGTFDGAGHTLSNLACATDDDMLAVGLFGVVSGTVENLTLAGAEVDGGTSAHCTGAIVGWLYQDGVVRGLRTEEATVSGTNCVGGVVGGSMYATIDSCEATGAQVVVVGDNDFALGEVIQADVAECGGLIVGGGFGGSVSGCKAQGTVEATGNEPVGLGGVGGCLQCMPLIENNEAAVLIKAGNGHAIGGLCGYAGMGDDGDGTVDEPAVITNCSVDVTIEADGATHVGGLVGTGLYYFGMEDRFVVRDCNVSGSIAGAVTPGCVCGRAQGSTVESCQADVEIDGEKGTAQIGETHYLYRSADQYEAGSDAAAVRLVDALAGTYTPLFDTLITEGTYADWFDSSLAVLDDETAATAAVDALQSSVTGELVGQEAVDAYAEDPDATAFSCGFLDDVAAFTFEVLPDGSDVPCGFVANGVDAQDCELFNHAYAYERYDENSGFYVFGTEEADAGEFAYVAVAADTPATTYHIEFRYGSDLDQLLNWTEGDYAYWMASGIEQGADAQTAKLAIDLFCRENLAE